MALTSLESILLSEKIRPRAARSTGFGVPVMYERPMPGSSGPYLVTGASCKFLLTRPIGDNVVRCGMFPCTVAEENTVLPQLCRALQVHGVHCISVQDVPAQPGTLLMAASVASADFPSNFMGAHTGLRVVVTDIDLPCMIWFGRDAGVHIRSGGHFGLILVLSALLLVKS